MKKITLYELYQILKELFGVLSWWPADSDIEMIIGSILTQNTSWTNALVSINNLRRETNFEIKRLIELPLSTIKTLIKPSGLYNNKAISIYQIIRWIDSFDSDFKAIKNKFANLREELLKQRGIGQETADCILLYVFDESEFIADKYAQKLISNLTNRQFSNYNQLKSYIQITEQFSLNDLKEFHGLIVEFGKIYLNKKEDFANSPLKDYLLI